MKNISESIFYFIAGHGRGWAFSSSDIAGRFARQQIDNALSDLAQEGKIRRVARAYMIIHAIAICYKKRYPPTSTK